MTETDYPTSWYAATRNPAPERPALDGDVTADVCIIGAGFSGLNTALNLLEAGMSVVLLEGAQVGFGASGRNGGQIVNSFSRDVDFVESRYGKSAAKDFGAMVFEGGKILKDVVRKYDIDCDLKEGGIHAAFTKKQLHELRETQARWQALGHDHLEIKTGSDIKNHINTDAYEGILVDNWSGHIHPLNLALGEAAAIEGLGGVIHEFSTVTRIDRGPNPVVHTDKGQVRCNYVVSCGNAYMLGLMPELEAKTMPCGTQIMATEVLGEDVVNSLLPTGACVEDCNYFLDYYRVSGDNRLLFGGGVNYGGGDPIDIEATRRPGMEKVFPQLKDVKIDYTWGGDFLLTMSRLAMIGNIDNNLYYAQGYSGHGVTNTHLAGKLIAEAIMGKESKGFDAFNNLPHLPFPGGRRFRKPYTRIGAIWYNLRDKLGI